MAHSVWTGGSRHTGRAALPHKNIQLCPFFTSAAIYHNRTDVLYSILHALIIFNEEVYIGTLKTLYNGAQSLRTGVLQCDFVEI